jgi:hypothetical protein
MLDAFDAVFKGTTNQGPVVFIFVVLAVLFALFALWYGKNILKRRLESELLSQEEERATQRKLAETNAKLAETVAAIGSVVSDTHAGVSSVLAHTGASRVELRMLLNGLRPVVNMARKISQATGIDLDEEIGRCSQALEDGTLEMRALTNQQIDADKQRRKL